MCVCCAEYKNSKFRVIDYGAVTTPAGMDILKRLELVYKGIDMLIKNYNIDEVGIEELFFNKNVKTAIKLQETANKMYPGLFRPMIIRNSRYNTKNNNLHII